MRTVLIAHHDAPFAEELATELREAGYRVIDCPGPWPPAARCIRGDRGYCRLTESADLMVYDPELTAVDKLRCATPVTCCRTRRDSTGSVAETTRLAPNTSRCS